MSREVAERFGDDVLWRLAGGEVKRFTACLDPREIGERLRISARR